MAVETAEVTWGVERMAVPTVVAGWGQVIPAVSSDLVRRVMAEVVMGLGRAKLVMVEVDLGRVKQVMEVVS